jgi:two-component system, OmpR family, response regulator MprA
MPQDHGLLLVVDDDPEWREALSDVLREEGYSVAVAEDGVAALDMLSHSDPLVVIADIQMPFMGGRQLLGRVRDDDGRVPVIIVSGEYIATDDVSLAGAFRVMSKPVALEELLSTVAKAVARRRAHLPLNKLWLAAGTVTKSRVRRTRRPRWEAIRRAVSTISTPTRAALLALVVASSLALLVRRRAALAAH